MLQVPLQVRVEKQTFQKNAFRRLSAICAGTSVKLKKANGQEDFADSVASGGVARKTGHDSSCRTTVTVP